MGNTSFVFHVLLSSFIFVAELHEHLYLLCHIHFYLIVIHYFVSLFHNSFKFLFVEVVSLEVFLVSVTSFCSIVLLLLISFLFF